MKLHFQTQIKPRICKRDRAKEDKTILIRQNTIDIR